MNVRTGWLNLMAAVISQAREDAAYRGSNKERVRFVEDAEAFLESQWYREMSEVISRIRSWDNETDVQAEYE